MTFTLAKDGDSGRARQREEPAEAVNDLSRRARGGGERRQREGPAEAVNGVSAMCVARSTSDGNSRVRRSAAYM
jgi:hypothetical protein